MSNPNGGASFTLTTTATGSAMNNSTITTAMATNCVNSDITTCGGVGWTMTLSGPGLSPTTASSANFTGGQDAATTSDTGSVTVYVGGTPYQTSFGAGDNTTTIAGRLASAISGGNCANAVPSGGTINLTAKNPGTGGECSLSATYAWNSSQFVNPSFTTSTSGAALGGALDAGAVNNNPLVTTYQYNTRGDMLCVHQKATDTSTDIACTGTTPPAVPASWRQRFFTYDSLSGILTAMNPETNSTGSTVITYNYDADGNVTSKTEPAPNQPWGSSAMSTINYSYDALNRLLDTVYPVGDPTPKASVRYDYSSFLGQTMTYSVGRAVASMTVDSQGNTLASNFTSYDQTGRAASSVQCNPGVTGCKTFIAVYDKLGDLTSLAYPGNGFTVTYGYDTAARLTSATDSSGVVYAQSPSFWATGAIKEFTAPNFNNNKYHVDLNNRLQPTEIWTGSAQGASALFDKQYSYNAPNTSQMNNGNIHTVTNVVDGARSQTFAYDSLNRLISARDQSHWSNTYTYDAWGNLYNKAPGSLPGESLVKTADTNNHLSGMAYDAAGNETADGAGGSMVYDAENRITTTAGVTYVYDADGRRIQKSTGINYWYGPTGGALAETDSAGNWTNYVFFAGQHLARNINGDVKYYITDHLRSTAMFVDKAGTQAVILDDNDFYPWGGIVPGVGKTTSNNTVKLTGQYRDTESQLDYFGARYYASTNGRFMSPDWAVMPTSVPYASFGDPQSLNLYSYVRNSPIVRVDSDGHFDDPFNTFGGGGQFSNIQSFAGWIATTITSSDGTTQTLIHPAQGTVSAENFQQPTPQSQQGSNQGGFWQKLGNKLSGDGWKTDAEILEERRQYLIDHKVESPQGPVDWKNAPPAMVNEAYKYIQKVHSAAEANHTLSQLGIATTVTFGHGARHLVGTKLTQAEVEAAIRADIQAAVKNSTHPTGNFWGRVSLNGQTIEYRAYTLPSGTINVGTYYIPGP